MASDQDEVALYKDLQGFLMADRTDLRMAATEAVLQVRDRAGMEKVIQHGLVALLAKNTAYPDRNVSINALQALVYLSSHGTTANQCVEDLMQAGGLNRMIEIALSSQPAAATKAEEEALWRKQVNFSMALLANMTRVEAGAVEVAGKTMPEEAIPTDQVDEKGVQVANKPTLELLLARFLSTHYVNESTKDSDCSDLMLEKGEEALDSHAGDPYQHFASVLMNSTQVEAGRRFVMRIIHQQKSKTQSQETQTSVFQKLLPFLKSPNPLRRRGVAGIVRNCCLDRDSAWWLINVVKVVKHLLYPLAGPEELEIDEKQGLDPDLWLEGPDKVREPDHLTRLGLVESILLLCASGRKSREQLRLQRVYVILKWADMVEEHEDVSATIYECVQFLRRDEEGTSEGSSDKFVSDAYRKPSTSRQVGANEDLDDID